MSRLEPDERPQLDMNRLAEITLTITPSVRMADSNWMHTKVLVQCGGVYDDEQGIVRWSHN